MVDLNKIIIVLLILLVLTGCTKKVIEQEIIEETEELSTTAESPSDSRFTVSSPDIHTEDMGNGLIRIYN